jgi:hypothetical protein
VILARPTARPSRHEAEPSTVDTYHPRRSSRHPLSHLDPHRCSPSAPTMEPHHAAPSLDRSRAAARRTPSAPTPGAALPFTTLDRELICDRTTHPRKGAPLSAACATAAAAAALLLAIRGHASLSWETWSCFLVSGSIGREITATKGKKGERINKLKRKGKIERIKRERDYLFTYKLCFVFILTIYIIIR